MLVCVNCGKIFDEEIGTHTEYHGHSAYYNEVVDNDAVCPDCHYGELVEATKCLVCGEWFYDENGVEVCEVCIDKSANIENGYELGEHDCCEVKVNGFLASVFTEDDIHAILLDYLKANKDKYAKEIKDFYRFDYSPLAELLIDRKEENNG